MTEYDKKEFRGLLRMMLEDEELLSMLIEYKKFPLLTGLDIGGYVMDRSVSYIKLEGDLDIEDGIYPELFDKIVSHCHKNLVVGYDIDFAETNQLLTRIKGAISYIRSKVMNECSFLVGVSDANRRNRRIVNTGDPDKAIELVLSVNGDTIFEELSILWKTE